MFLIGELPVVIIACKVFKDFIEHFLQDELSEKIIFMDYGLHSVPRNLNKALQEKLDAIHEPSLIVFGYGLCGNGLHEIKAGKHYLLIPRTDDCIAILLGSYRAYLQEFNSQPATYYLSKGWLESGSNPLQEYENYVEKYGKDLAAWLMDQQYRNYKRLVLVAHNREDLEKYRPHALKVADYCSQWGMYYEELMGSGDYIERLTEVIKNTQNLDEDFILVPPGEILTQGSFLRK